MRTCVIFNPVAKGNKARYLRRHLDEFGSTATLMQTNLAGHARQLAAQAVHENFEIIVAAGGDGTVNEVLNGIGDVPDGFARVRLAVLPVGTVNVFAKELRLPTDLKAAWQMIQQAKETHIDLPQVEFTVNGSARRRFFAQLAGAGLDARAIELLNWPLKKKIGALAYVVSGLKAGRECLPKIQVSAGAEKFEGELVLLGNGSYYGGRFKIFPLADLRDGLLEVCIFPRANWFTVLRCGPSLLLRGRLPECVAQTIRAPAVTLASSARAGFEVDGEWAAPLPAKFSIQEKALRVIAR